jgi:hypothetical protein
LKEHKEMKTEPTQEELIESLRDRLELKELAFKLSSHNITIKDSSDTLYIQLAVIVKEIYEDVYSSKKHEKFLSSQISQGELIENHGYMRNLKKHVKYIKELYSGNVIKIRKEKQVKVIKDILLAGKEVRTHDMIFKYGITRTAARIADINKLLNNKVICLDRKDWYKGKGVYILTK